MIFFRASYSVHSVFFSSLIFIELSPGIQQGSWSGDNGWKMRFVQLSANFGHSSVSWNKLLLISEWLQRLSWSELIWERSWTELSWERSWSELIWKRSWSDLIWERSRSELIWERSRSDLIWERSWSELGELKSVHIWLDSVHVLRRLLRQVHLNIIIVLFWNILLFALFYCFQKIVHLHCFCHFKYFIIWSFYFEPFCHYKRTVHFHVQIRLRVLTPEGNKVGCCLSPEEQ